MKRLLLVLMLLVPVVSQAKILSRGIADNTITATNISNTYCSSIIAVSNDPTTGAGKVAYINLVDNTATLDTETGEDLYTVPVAMKAHSLRVTAAGSISSAFPSDSYIVTLRDDAADTSLTCTLATEEASCTDTAHVATIAAGSKLTVSLETSALGATTYDITEALVSLCMTE